MKILGVETSCDETAAAVVADGRTILSSVVTSSLKEHAKHGGIIPEIASRRQLEYIIPVVKRALTQSGCSLKQMKAIAVTSAPGLIGSLLVGTTFAKALSIAVNKPLIEVDHIKAHLYASFLRKNDRQIRAPKPTLPAIGLVVSGGHTSLYHIKSFQQFKLLGRTRDDAAGEAFDKVARLLNLGFPGGPVIDRLAKKGAATRLKFPRARLSCDYDFSFSGLKTSVLYYHQKHAHTANYSLKNVVRAFQDSIVDTLVDKAIGVCVAKKIRTLVIGGGVAANSQLRETLTTKCRQNKIQVTFPALDLCMDNAAMIAGLGYHFLT